MARYQVTLAYDGTEFAGYQRQALARTVQAEIEASLRRLGWLGSTILSAGRTDTGVHASGQVIAFDLDWRHSNQQLLQALNAGLPADIAIRAVEQAGADFHPRYDAVLRRYRYRIYCQENRDPLRERFSWRVWPELNGTVLHQAEQIFTGTHDFSAFGSPPRPGGSGVRTVTRVTWVKQGDEWLFEIAANAFLYHMVRRLTFLQVQAGQERQALQDLENGFENPGLLMPGLAPPQGLALVEVTYPERNTIPVEEQNILSKPAEGSN